MNELIFVRHGESKYNVRLTDNLDSELTEKGIEQVKCTSKFLEVKEFQGITSPYLRCLQTADIIQKETGIPFIVSVQPREIMVEYDICEIQNRKKDFPQFNWDLIPESLIFKKETIEEFLIRMQTFIEEVQEKTLIVSHGTPINTLYELKLGIKHKPSTSYFVKNASVSYIKNNQGIYLGKNYE